MAFTADLFVRTDTNATGNKTISLAAGRDPKAVIAWAVPSTADGTVVHRNIGFGFATYRGSVVQQAYVTARGLDLAPTGDCATGTNTDAMLVLLTDAAASAARDLEIDLVSMQGGGTPQVVYNVVNAHASAVRVFMLVLGGSDITDALVDNFTMTTASATQDETVVAGFGQPDLLFFASGNTTALQDLADHPRPQLGFAKKGEAGRCLSSSQANGNTSSLAGITQRSDRALIMLGAPAATTLTPQVLMALDTTVANWPTDGFRMLYDAIPGFAFIGHYLALKTTAQIVTGASDAPIVGTPPVDQDDDVGFPPKLAFLFGWNLAATTATQPANADTFAFGIGAYDGTQEAWCGISEDDGVGTMDANRQQSTAKIIQNYGPTAVLQSEADGAFSGNIFRRSWNDIDTVAREHQWLVMGDAPVAPPADAPPPSLVMAPRRRFLP